MKALRWLSPGPDGMYAVVDDEPTVRLVWAPPGRPWAVLSHRPDLGRVSAVAAPGGWWR